MGEFVYLVISGLVTGCLYTLVAITVVMIYKTTRVVSIAHGQIMTIIALFLWYCLVSVKAPFIIWFPLTFGFAVGLGWVVNKYFMRPLIGQPEFSSFLMTFAIYIAIGGFLQMMLKGLTKSFPSFLPPWSLSIMGVNLTFVHLLSVGATVLVFLGLFIFFNYTTIGLGMRAICEDHLLAQGTGITVHKLFSIIWMVSAIVSGLAGVSLAIIMGIQYELPTLGIKGLIVALFGGLESFPGALLAGLLLGLFENLAAGYLDPYVGGGIKEVAAYVALLFFLLIKPYGLFGLPRIERI